MQNGFSVCIEPTKLEAAQTLSVKDALNARSLNSERFAGTDVVSGSVGGGNINNSENKMFKMKTLGMATLAALPQVWK